MVQVIRIPVRYHEDASLLFAHLGGVARPDTLLLESADIDSKKNTGCIAVLEAAARVTCHGQTVTVAALTTAGTHITERLCDQLGEFVSGRDEQPLVATFEFPPVTVTDERERLRAISNVEVLRQLQQHADYQGEVLPLLGGGFAFDYLGTYEQLPPVADGPNTFPDYQFLLAETVLTIDHLTKEAFVESLNPASAGEWAARIADTPPSFATDAPARAASQSTEPLTVRASMDDAEFRGHVRDMQEYIHNGDIYQGMPARMFTADCPDAFAAYRALRDTNPSPYMFYLHGPDYELFGASPESNLKFDAASRLVQVYPVAGTRPRGTNPELDIRAELEMRTDSKEVAEHTMLVDLARNDLARVAVPTTRKVADLLQVDRYSRVMHLVSRVTATLHPDFDCLDAYRACMNMGTLTGAPKLRATELLRQVEGRRRGSYGGAIGYLKGDGSMDTAIVIRSAFVRNGTAIVQAGAGVVRDSQPQSEANETLHKAYAVLTAIASAQGKKVEVLR